LTSGRRRRNQPPPGPAPDASLDDIFLAVGRIVAPHGLRGEVKLVLTTDRPEKMGDLRRVYLDGSETPVRIARLRIGGNGREAILKLEGTNDRNAAELLRGSIVRIRGDQLPPPEEGSFFHYQIIGLLAEDEAGKPLGEVTEIIEAGEVDVYVVTAADGSQQLFPALADVVLTIDPPARRMVIRPQRYAESDSN
jgi:16S rRNA processing protein RimM